MLHSRNKETGRFSKNQEAGCFKKEGGTAATVLSPLIKHIKFYERNQETVRFLKTKKQYASKKKGNSPLIHET